MAVTSRRPCRTTLETILDHRPAAVRWMVPLLAVLFLAAPLAAQETGHGLSKAEEIALAEGAGPPALVAGATIYVLGEHGYETAREGVNGASCLVSRDRIDTLEPLCFDAEGTRAILPVYLERGRLRAAGMSDQQIEERMAAAFASGEYVAPAKPGIAYMLSPHNKVFNGTEVISYPPHIMVYAPYATNADIGSEMTDPFMPWVLNEGDPHAYIIVVVGGR
jgi:hypothetical protein